MLSESDRKEILFAIKEFLKVNNLPHSNTPDNFTYYEPNLDENEFVRTTLATDIAKLV